MRHLIQTRASSGCHWALSRAFCFSSSLALKKATLRNAMLLTGAIESMNPAMVKEVLDCVQRALADPQEVKRRSALLIDARGVEVGAFGG